MHGQTQSFPGLLAAILALAASNLSAPPAAGQSPAIPASKPSSGPAALQYELLVPPGEPGQLGKMPLVLYLHPTGQPRLDQAKADYWPMLRERKCLMALPKSASDRMWAGGQDKAVLDMLAEIQTRHSVDAGRVILLGVSGGGQFALFLADHWPEKFRAVVAVSTSPVVVRGHESEWFYPSRKTLKTCPYFVVNPITQGASLLYWRQVQAKLAGDGASISILPVAGVKDDYLPPPKELAGWLDEVLAGKHPAALPDPQKQAVAKLFAPAVAALPGAIDKASAAGGGQMISSEAGWRLTLIMPFDFDRSQAEDKVDSTGGPLTQLRLEHKTWPIVIRAEARATAKPMDEALAAEEAENVARGMLYQVYHTGQVKAGPRSWTYRIGSMTYPDRKRGWVSTLFLHAAAPADKDPRRWLSVVVLDETEEPDAAELAGYFKGLLGSLSPAATQPTAVSSASIRPASQPIRPTSQPASRPATTPVRLTTQPVRPTTPPIR